MWVKSLWAFPLGRIRIRALGLVLVALLLAGCATSQPGGVVRTVERPTRSFTDGRNYALQHKSGTLASVCFAIYQLPHVPVPKGDSLEQWLSGCASVFPGQAPHL